MKRSLILPLVLIAMAGCSKKGKEAGPTVPTTTSATAAAAEAVVPVAAPLSYELRRGRETYRHYCLTCHGEGGAGDGFNAFNLDPHPRDYSDPAFQKKKTDADLADAIRRGGAGVGLSALMPPWGHTLPDAEINQVVLYIRTLQRKPE